MALQKGSKVLVTGGNGFLGYHVCRTLAIIGCEVHSFDKAPIREDSMLTEWYDGDITSLNDITDAVDACKPDAVVHLAAKHYIPECNADPAGTWKCNVVGTRALLESFFWAGHKPKALLAASSADVYTDSTLPLSENDLAWPFGIYGFSKRAMEFMLERWSVEKGVPVTIARYFNMYGWGETTPHLIPVLVDQITAGCNEIVLGNADSKRDYIHVAEAAWATGQLLNRNTGLMTINIGSGTSRSARTLVRIMGNLVGKDLTIKCDPNRMRPVDRECLVSDNSKLVSMNLEPMVGMRLGLNILLSQGNGPYLRQI